MADAAKREAKTAQQVRGHTAESAVFPIQKRPAQAVTGKDL
jgi:hypothetical protein